jgi:predicted permease
MVAFFGSRSAGPLAMAILAEVMVLLSLGGAIMGSSRRGGNGWKTLLIASTIRN